MRSKSWPLSKLSSRYSQLLPCSRYLVTQLVVQAPGNLSVGEAVAIGLLGAEGVLFFCAGEIIGRGRYSLCDISLFVIAFVCFTFVSVSSDMRFKLFSCPSLNVLYRCVAVASELPWNFFHAFVFCVVIRILFASAEDTQTLLSNTTVHCHTPLALRIKSATATSLHKTGPLPPRSPRLESAPQSPCIESCARVFKKHVEQRLHVAS